jgi:hypothetical protein
MTSMQKMIEQINTRLAALEREARDHPDWLTRLMLAGPRAAEVAENAAEAHYTPSPAPRLSASPGAPPA